MTAQRQERNGWRRGIAFIALVAVVAVPAASQFTAQATTTERVVADRYSGLAIGGFDPVSYFADGEPRIGLPEVEVAHAGALWRFRNEANRAAFVARPDIYAPQFGGYDPVDVARGVALAGNSLLWLVAGQRLYLFGHRANRDAFAADPAGVLRDAQQRWPAIRETLAQ